MVEGECESERGATSGGNRPRFIYNCFSVWLLTSRSRQASYDAPTESELLELEAENDGTAAGAEAAEKRRAKTENWAQYTDDNKKGAGNTMNRG